MLGYVFWSGAALLGAVWTARVFLKLLNAEAKLPLTTLMFYVVMHAALLSGSCAMALGLFKFSIGMSGTLALFLIIAIHNSICVWDLRRSLNQSA